MHDWHSRSLALEACTCITCRSTCREAPLSCHSIAGGVCGQQPAAHPRDGGGGGGAGRRRGGQPEPRRRPRAHPPAALWERAAPAHPRQRCRGHPPPLAPHARLRRPPDRCRCLPPTVRASFLLHCESFHVMCLPIQISLQCDDLFACFATVYPSSPVFCVPLRMISHKCMQHLQTAIFKRGQPFRSSLIG